MKHLDDYADQFSLYMNADLALYFDVSVQTITSWVRKGLLRPSTYINGKYPLYVKSDVLDCERALKNSGSKIYQPGSNARRSESAKRLWQQRKAAQN